MIPFLPMSLFILLISWELAHFVTCFEHHGLRLKDLINGCKDWLLFLRIVCKNKGKKLTRFCSGDDPIDTHRLHSLP